VKKRTTRTAWWLSAVLAVALLGGGVLLVANYQSRLTGYQGSVYLIPRGNWDFRHESIYWVSAPKTRTDVYLCGFFEIDVTHH
jgi:hypothetical protein